jgi:hypothetical protein
VACLDTPDRLLPALSSATAGGNELTGATVVFVTVPRSPGLASRLRHRFRASALAARLEQAAAAARAHDAARAIVLSTVFTYDDDRGLPLHVGSPTLMAAETAPAAAAEGAARLFTSLGGDSVVLRLGWTCGREEGITRRVLAAARRGWRLIDGDPGAWLALIAEQDAARAVLPALTVPPGTYNVTDGAPVTQGRLNAALETALGRSLHSLDDPGWGCDGTLFGVSRRIADTTFGDLTGWRPQGGRIGREGGAWPAGHAPAGAGGHGRTRYWRRRGRAASGNSATVMSRGDYLARLGDWGSAVSREGPPRNPGLSA